MPAKNSVKEYLENGYYHLYNRGVEKRKVFLDERDFSVFTSYLKTYLSPKDEKKLGQIIDSPETNPSEKYKARIQLSLKNFSGEIELLAYSLLPNHFHLLVKQKSPDGIDRFMNALATRYSVYFNRHYKRVGPLWQGVYKAVSVESNNQLLWLSNYIHRNPLVKLNLPLNRWPEINWPFSLPEYLGQRKTDWIKPEEILSYFKKSDPGADYRDFISANLDPFILARIALDMEDEN